MNSTLPAKTSIAQYLENIKKDLSANRDQKANLKKAITSIDSLLDAIRQFSDGKIMVISRQAKASKLEITTRPAQKRTDGTDLTKKKSSPQSSTQKIDRTSLRKIITKSSNPQARTVQVKTTAKKPVVKNTRPESSAAKNNSRLSASKPSGRKTIKSVTRINKK